MKISLRKRKPTYILRINKFGRNILNPILNNSLVKRRLLPNNMGNYMYHHCTQEYNNFGDILLEIYANEHL